MCRVSADAGVRSSPFDYPIDGSHPQRSVRRSTTLTSSFKPNPGDFTNQRQIKGVRHVSLRTILFRNGVGLMRSLVLPIVLVFCTGLFAQRGGSGGGSSGGTGGPGASHGGSGPSVGN